MKLSKQIERALIKSISDAFKPSKPTSSSTTSVRKAASNSRPSGKNADVSSALNKAIANASKTAKKNSDIKSGFDIEF